ncbi:hypothetical protein [Streptomyces sp. NPDC004658]
MATLPLVLQAKTDEAIVVTGIKVNVLSSEVLPDDGEVLRSGQLCHYGT